MATYRVNLWGSKPGENDDCWTGDEYTTREAALAAYADPWGVGGFDAGYYLDPTSDLWIEIDGDDIHEERQIQAAKRARKTDDGWKLEAAMQAGMAFGCDGYNDEMGF